MSSVPDLFVDANQSSHFCRPMDAHYRDLIEWLWTDGHLVVCQALIVEYSRAVSGSDKQRTLVALVDRLQREGRLRRFGKAELREFRISERMRKKLLSNRSDHDFLKIVLLSDRKLGLSADYKFRRDVNSFPGSGAFVGAHPSDVDYRSR